MEMSFQAKIHDKEIKGGSASQALQTKPLSDEDEAIAEKARIDALNRIMRRK